MIFPGWSAEQALLALYLDGPVPVDDDEGPRQLALRSFDQEVVDWPVDHQALSAPATIRFSLKALPDAPETIFAALRANGHSLYLADVDDAAGLTQAQALAPDVITGLFWRVGMTPSAHADHATLLRLIGLLNADADNKQIEQALSGSPHLLFGLLRLVNSVAFSSGRQRIGSIGHALSMLGRRQLQRWVMLLLYAERYDGADMFSPLLLMTCVRARLMENLCRCASGALRNQADTAFMVGMLSSLDKVLGQPMAELLTKVSLPAEGEAALLHGEGSLAELLALVQSGETMDRQAVMAALAHLQLDDAEWSAQSLAAWGWLERLREGG